MKKLSSCKIFRQQIVDSAKLFTLINKLDPVKGQKMKYTIQEKVSGLIPPSKTYKDLTKLISYQTKMVQISSPKLKLSEQEETRIDQFADEKLTQFEAADQIGQPENQAVINQGLQVEEERELTADEEEHVKKIFLLSILREFIITDAYERAQESNENSDQGFDLNKNFDPLMFDEYREDAGLDPLNPLIAGLSQDTPENQPNSEELSKEGTFAWNAKSQKLEKIAEKGASKGDEEREAVSYSNWYAGNVDPDDLQKHKELLDRQYFRGPFWESKEKPKPMMADTDATYEYLSYLKESPDEVNVRELQKKEYEESGKTVDSKFKDVHR